MFPIFTFPVDDVMNQTKSSVGTEDNVGFGKTNTNSYVYFGGMPLNHFETDLKQLALPSVMFEANLQGYIRNVIYGNCSCLPARGVVIPEDGQVFRSREPCDIQDPCGDCLCISTDETSTCRCLESNCVQGECFLVGRGRSHM